ncbi:hypothetical protein NWF34_10170 [Gordonia sp. GONU]|uniref:hypothetical protein n=1 Tax=Gordonia sp. GONU TaxID=2972949 RepID=UPI0021ACD5DA|nr:hypothetical protein [Gordonia sp. GONU]MCR8897314.1 hypothetical protein [Gordonia sp. GONU]
MTRWLEVAWPRLRHLIVHGGTLCQIVLYPCIFIGGLYMLITSAPNVVEEEMGGVAQSAWIWLSVACPVLTLVAYLARRSSGWIGDLGPGLGIGANVGLTFALTSYVAAVLQASWIGKGMYALWPFIGFTMLVGLIALRDVLRLVDANRLRKVTKS